MSLEFLSLPVRILTAHTGRSQNVCVMDLHALPHDVILELLLLLEPRDICRLEQCSSDLRALVDDRLWKETLCAPHRAVVRLARARR